MQPPPLINSDGEEEQVIEKILRAENNRRDSILEGKFLLNGNNLKNLIGKLKIILKKLKL